MRIDLKMNNNTFLTKEKWAIYTYNKYKYLHWITSICNGNILAKIMPILTFKTSINIWKSQISNVFFISTIYSNKGPKIAIVFSYLDAKFPAVGINYERVYKSSPNKVFNKFRQVNVNKYGGSYKFLKIQCIHYMNIWYFTQISSKIRILSYYIIIYRFLYKVIEMLE
jgi:hypothetical protein